MTIPTRTVIPSPTFFWSQSTAPCWKVAVEEVLPITWLTSEMEPDPAQILGFNSCGAIVGICSSEENGWSQPRAARRRPTVAQLSTILVPGAWCRSSSHAGSEGSPEFRSCSLEGLVIWQRSVIQHPVGFTTAQRAINHPTPVCFPTALEKYRVDFYPRVFSIVLISVGDGDTVNTSA